MKQIILEDTCPSCGLSFANRCNPCRDGKIPKGILIGTFAVWGMCAIVMVVCVAAIVHGLA